MKSNKARKKGARIRKSKLQIICFSLHKNAMYITLIPTKEICLQLCYGNFGR